MRKVQITCNLLLAQTEMDAQANAEAKAQAKRIKEEKLKALKLLNSHKGKIPINLHCEDRRATSYELDPEDNTIK